MEDDVEYNHGKLIYRKGQVVEISNFPICFRRDMLFGPFVSRNPERAVRDFFFKNWYFGCCYVTVLCGYSNDGACGSCCAVGVHHRSGVWM